MIYDKYNVTPAAGNVYKNSKTSIEWNLPCGHIGKKSLESMSSMFKKRGHIVCRSCALKEDYKDGARKSMKVNSEYVDCECDKCGKKRRLLMNSYSRQLKKNNGVVICQSCSRKGKGLKELSAAKEEVIALHGTLNSDVWNTTKSDYFFTGKCGHSFEARYDNTIHISRKRGYIQCPSCSLKQMMSNKSNAESEIEDFITELGVLVHRNYRPAKKYFEYDLYCPELNVAFEYHWTYWHSETVLKTKTGIKVPRNYHLDKQNEALTLGIDLIQIFDSEWIKNKEIIKSMIRNKVKKTTNKLSARDGVVKTISSSRANAFLDDTHIFGSVKGAIHYALIIKDEIVAVMSVREERGSVNIVRYSTLLNCLVRGGFSKILKHMRLSIGKVDIVSYADRRLSAGKLYENNGFTKEGQSSPSYWYFHKKNPMELLNRRNFQKKYLKRKLEIFDPTLTEYENMKNNGYDRVWDAGHSKYLIRA